MIIINENMKTFEELVILIADDDEGHVDLIIEGLHTSGVCNRILTFTHGQELWRFLSGEPMQDAESEEVFNPNNSYLLLLDIRMPYVDGIEVLKRMKAHKKLKKIPVLMLTTTDDPIEVEECYQLGCSVYITKPVDFIKFTEILKRLGLFIQIVTV